MPLFPPSGSDSFERSDANDETNNLVRADLIPPKNDAVVLTLYQAGRTVELSGWAGIEHYLLKHDTLKLKDYADDVDALLVFVSGISGYLAL